MNLYEKITDIKTELMSLLTQGVYPEEIEQFIIGEKFRMSGKIDKPILWVVPLPADTSDDTFANNEYWKWEFAIVSIVKAHDDLDGQPRAEKIALAASMIIIQNRTLNGKIKDSIRKSFTPAYDKIINQDESLWGSAVGIELRFFHRDV